MNESKMIGKLKKLKTMIDRGTLHESENAQRIYDRLIKKYSISNQIYTEEELFRIIIPNKVLSIYASHIAAYLTIKTYWPGEQKKSMVLKCTQDEYTVYCQAWNGVLNAFKRSDLIRKKTIAEAKIKQNSYLYGFAISTFPLNDVCPKCGACTDGAIKVKNGKTIIFTCKVCQAMWKEHSVIGEYDYSSYSAGCNDSGRLLTGF